MAKCTKIRKRKQEICAGDMRDRVTLQNRAILPPTFGSAAFIEDFEDDGTRWAMINTVKGKTFFDSVGTAIPITHEIAIRFDPTVTDETWIEFDGRRLDILNFQDLDERHEYLFFQCTDRGSTGQPATQA